MIKRERERVYSILYYLVYYCCVTGATRIESHTIVLTTPILLLETRDSGTPRSFVRCRPGKSCVSSSALLLLQDSIWTGATNVEVTPLIISPQEEGVL